MVLELFNNIDSDQIALSCITLGEIKIGVLKKAKKDKQSASILQKWLDNLYKIYGNQILNIDNEVCEIWSQLCCIDASNPIDALIAAQAIRKDLILVTRNTKHFNMFRVKLLNPFIAERDS